VTANADHAPGCLLVGLLVAAFLAVRPMPTGVLFSTFENGVPVRVTLEHEEAMRSRHVWRVTYCNACGRVVEQGWTDKGCTWRACACR
jgi:hypothetical protein